MHRIAGTDVFYFSTTLEPDARITYEFFVDFEKYVADDSNPQRDEVDYGAERPVLTMPDWRPPTFLGEAAPGRRGRLESVPFSSRLCDIRIPLQVYLPAVYDPRKEYPVLYVQMGMMEIRLHLRGRPTCMEIDTSTRSPRSRS